LDTWYNSSFHSSLGRSPFEALYGRQPRILGITPPGAAQGKLEDWFVERAHMNHVIHDHLARAMKKHAVGTQVYLKIQPYVQ
jgi:hypothetical protein